MSDGNYDEYVEEQIKKEENDQRMYPSEGRHYIVKDMMGPMFGEFFNTQDEDTDERPIDLDDKEPQENLEKVTFDDLGTRDDEPPF